MMDLNLDMTTITELEVMLENKSKAITDCTCWINRNRPDNDSWAEMTAGRIELILEVQAIEAELTQRRIKLFN